MKVLNWKVSADAVELFGEKLITDKITAIFELVKNTYDANASNVCVWFQGKKTVNSIAIIDNGYGMSDTDLEHKWLVVGTNSKRISSVSPAPFNRLVVGEKGIGRFACDKIGSKLIIYTKSDSHDKTCKLTVDWDGYRNRVVQAEADSNKTKEGESRQLLFNELDAELEYLDNCEYITGESGTALIITGLRDLWDIDTIIRVDNQLSRIIPQTARFSTNNFKITLRSPFKAYEAIEINPLNFTEYATIHKLCLSDAVDTNTQSELCFKEDDGVFDCIVRAKRVFGQVSLEFMYFDLAALRRVKKDFKGQGDYIEGVKMYRDGVICTPFAEYENNIDNRRDVFGIDKRRYADAFSKLSTRQFIMNVYITKEHNSNIIDSTNRQDFVDNPEFRALKAFVIMQIDELAKYRKYLNAKQRDNVRSELVLASQEVKGITAALKRVVKSNPETKLLLDKIIKSSSEVTKKVEAGAKESIVARKESHRREQLYLSLMSLQDFANELAHGIRFAIAPAKQAAEFLKIHMDDVDKRVICMRYSVMIFDQLEKVSELVDFMLSSAQIDTEPVEFSLKRLIISLFRGPFSSILSREGIETMFEITQDVQLLGNPKMLEDVFTNLISNAVKFLKDTDSKLIKCSVEIQKSNVLIRFADSGPGIHDSMKDTLFELFQSTTQSVGGNGLGLFIVKSRIKSLNGSIHVVSGEYPYSGANFEILLPISSMQ